MLERVKSRWVLRTVALIAALGAAHPAFAAGVPVHEAKPAQKKEAKKSFDKGQKLQAEGKVDEALAAYRASHDVVADPKTRLMIARALRDSGELIPAEAEYRAALSDAESAVSRDPKQQETLDAIKKDLGELDGILGWLTIELVHAPEGTRVTIDGDALEASKVGARMRVAPGPLEVIAQAPDGTEVSRKVAITAGQTATVKLPFARKSETNTYFAPASEPKPEDDEPKAPAAPEATVSTGSGTKTLAYVAGGVGVLGLGAFTVFGLMSNSKFNDLEESCPANQCAADRQSDIDDGKRLQLFANIGLAVGVVGIGTGAALLIFGGSSEPETKPATAELGIGLGSLELRGRFQ